MAGPHDLDFDMAGAFVARREALKGRHGLPADLQRIGAARGKGATGGRMRHIGRAAGNGGKLVALLIDARDRRQKALRIGMGGVGEQRIDGRALHHPAAIHDHDAFA